jgi:hypothetical protein
MIRTLKDLLSKNTLHENLVIWAKPINGKISAESEAEWCTIDERPEGLERVAGYQELSGFALRQGESLGQRGFSKQAIAALVHFLSSRD